jgi:serine protease AprX
VVFLLSALLIFQSASNAYGGITLVPGQGVVLTGADGVVLTGADGVVLTGADSLLLTGAEGVVLTGADGVVLTGADALTFTGLEGVVLTGADSVGIESLDPELAWALDSLPNTSFINVIVVFHRIPTDSDFDSLRSAGVFGGTFFCNLPMVMINATKGQIAAISTNPNVRTIYSNKTFEFFTHDTRIITGETKVTSDPALTQRNQGVSLSGRGVTVAVLDTGIDATHPDLAYGTQVMRNARVVDLQGSAPTFMPAVVVDGLPDSDLVMGHGTFVSEIIAGTGVASGGYYGGMAPGAKLLGVSAGDASLFFVLSGIDYILSHREEMNIRVVNCSFGISGVFDANDPVNIATKIMHDAGISVVFSAGNRGNQPNSLNPYSVADWVIGVGSGTKGGSLSTFSSRGAAGYGTYHPSLVAPGESVVSARAIGVNVVGTLALPGDLQTVPPQYLARYTCSSGTSFAAPHVSGTIALMLEANPSLTVDQIKKILQETASPMLGYSQYEVGAGYLNTYAAVRRAVLGNQLGQFRGNLNNQQVSYSRDSLAKYSGTVGPWCTFSRTFTVPSDALFATVQLGWIPRGLPVSRLNATLSTSGQSIALSPPGLIALPAYKKTGVTISDPTPGNWTISVSNSSLPLLGSSQPIVVAVEIIRANYQISGLNQLTSADRSAATRAIRTGMLKTLTGDFAGSALATRLDAARAVMLGAGPRVPQYLPDVPSFSDEPQDGSAVFIESVTHSPVGDLLNSQGGSFSPESPIDRLTVAMAIVKALGLDDLALASSQINPGVVDWNSIPQASRGYVSVAVSRNLMRSLSGSFRPSDSITRLDLAIAGAALQKAAR